MTNVRWWLACMVLGFLVCGCASQDHHYRAGVRDGALYMQAQYRQASAYRLLQDETCRLRPTYGTVRVAPGFRGYTYVPEQDVVVSMQAVRPPGCEAN